MTTLDQDCIIASEFGVAVDAGRAEQATAPVLAAKLEAMTSEEFNAYVVNRCKPACPKCNGEGNTGTGRQFMTMGGVEDDTELCECQYETETDDEPIDDDDPGCDYDWPDGDCPRGVKVQ